MTPAQRVVAVAAWMLVFLCGLSSVHGVSCWSERKEGSETCGWLLGQNMTVEECCKKTKYGESVSWSTVDGQMLADAFKFLIILGGVPHCNLCEQTCEQKTCGPGRVCVMKGGRPRCVCKPDCNQNSTSHRGPVCATNGKQYRSMCALLKMKCRQQDDHFELEVAYNGPCQDSCKNVQCLGDNCCEEDQHGRPHCVSYSAITCPGPFREEFVCGADGVSYETLCQLRRTSCLSGEAIAVVHEGRCENLTSCNDTSCVTRKQCMWDTRANTSSCILCNYTCRGWADKVPLCASDGQTYGSWCELQNHICVTGEYKELVNWGGCGPGPDGEVPDITDPGSGYHPWGYDQIDFTPSIQILHELHSSMYRDEDNKDDNDTSTTASPSSNDTSTATRSTDTTTLQPADAMDDPLAGEDITYDVIPDYSQIDSPQWNSAPDGGPSEHESEGGFWRKMRSGKFRKGG